MSAHRDIVGDIEVRKLNGGRWHLICPPETFTVGEWARAVRQAADRVPHQIERANGTWRANPDRATAEREVAAAMRTVAAHLEVPLAEIGPCAACRAYHHHYGPAAGSAREADPGNHGGPLCPGCLARVQAGRVKAGARFGVAA